MKSHDHRENTFIYHVAKTTTKTRTGRKQSVTRFHKLADLRFYDLGEID